MKTLGQKGTSSAATFHVKDHEPAGRFSFPVFHPFRPLPASSTTPFTATCIACGSWTSQSKLTTDGPCTTVVIPAD